MRRDRSGFQWLFSTCAYCDVLFWILLGLFAGGLLVLLACWVLYDLYGEHTIAAMAHPGDRVAPLQ